MGPQVNDRTGGAFAAWQGMEQVRQWQRDNQNDIRRTERRQRIWTSTGYSLGSIGVGSGSVEAVNAGASGPHWLTLILLGCMGVSGGLLYFLDPVEGYRAAGKELSWLSVWENTLALSLVQLSNPEITRDKVQGILEELAETLRRLREQIRVLRETKDFRTPNSPFS